MDELLEAARTARLKAYAPYSHFLVGCALRAASGTIHVGCNVENASYSLVLCAEANAIGSMIAAGDDKIVEIAVVGSGSDPCPPCGACRQRIREFAGSEVKIHMAGAEGGLLTASLFELLPHSFGPEFLLDP